MTFTARLERTLAAATAAVVGALALVPPAHASAPPPATPRAELTSAGTCSPDEWKVSWKLTTSLAAGAVGVFSNVTASFTSIAVPPGHGGEAPPPPPTPSVPELTTFVNNGTVTGDAVVTADQSFPASAYAHVYGVALKLTLTWSVAGVAGPGTELRATATKPAGCHAVTDPGTVVPPPLGSVPDDDADTGVGEPSQSASASSSPSSSASAGTSAPASPSSVPSPSVPGPGVTTDPAGAGSGTGSGGGHDGDLALTGAAAGFLGGGAALLVLVGVALFVIARRRRMEFTA